MEQVTIEEIRRFLAVEYGDGYGDGSGDGSGSGSGSGYGDGSGSGSGSGDGDGSGSGYGDGSGYGSGSGSGYGDGSGYGSGDIKSFNSYPVFDVDGISTIFYSIHANYAKCAIVQNDLTLKDCYVACVDDSFAHGDTLADAVRAVTEKALEVMPEDERIERFRAEFPSLQTTAKCSVFYSWHHILTGSCTFGRNEFVKAHGLDMDKDYTVDYFLSITKGSYGGETIKRLKESYDN